MLLHYSPGVAEKPVSARASSLCLSTNHVLHDFVDGAISGGAGLAASAPGDKRKTFSTTSFFVILCSSYTQIQFVQKFCFMPVENGWQSGKQIKSMVHPQGLESEVTFVRIDLF